MNQREKMKKTGLIIAFKDKEKHKRKVKDEELIKLGLKEARKKKIKKNFKARVSDLALKLDESKNKKGQ